MTSQEYIVEIEEIRPQLMKVAAAFVSDYNTEDIVQDTIAYCHKKLATFDPEKSQFSSWVIRRLRHFAMNALKADDRRQRLESETPAEFDPLEEDTGEFRRAQPRPKLGELEPRLVPHYDDVIMLKGALAELTDKQREVVLAVIVEEYSMEEYAEKTGRTKNAIKCLLDAGLSRMRKYLGVDLEAITRQAA